ncbi:MAG: MucR family transcriptional regulator [Acetobacteraceae bacterium]|nr:MucR family transcriptional regulator [Acetobacteraceae bacterium]MDW8399909.1 MucR family transcriptional regulator [Acetobacteraceae bacterium]
MAEDTKPAELLALTAQIVSAHLSHNTVAAGEVPALIRDVHGTLAALASGAAPAAPAEKPTPAVPIKKSVHPDYLICLEDGKKLKMLKRHLKSAFNMTPEQYRERWGLPPDYPMVAPNYAARRSELAKKIGLGTKRREAAKGRKRGAA